MITSTDFTQSDLVLQLTGGPRNGEMIPVATRKCFLGIETCDEAISNNPQCVIFRGPNGAVVRSYSDSVLFNGTPSSVHWLQEGDEIKFPNSMTVQVAQLGTVDANDVDIDDAEAERVEKECLEAEREAEREVERLEAEREAERVEAERLEAELEAERVEAERVEAERLEAELEAERVEAERLEAELEAERVEAERVEEEQLEAEQLEAECLENQTVESALAQNVKVESSEEVESSENVESSRQYEGRLDFIEAELSNLHSLNNETISRFDHLEDRISQLTDQLSQLVSLTLSERQNHPSSDAVALPPEAIEDVSMPADPTTEFASMDEASDDDVTEYYSHNDESEEQIMTFDPKSEESIEASDFDDVSIMEAPVEQVCEPSEQTPTDQTAQAEKDSRLLEMERIFGGALTESDPETESTVKADYSNDAEEPTNNGVAEESENVLLGADPDEEIYAPQNQFANEQLPTTFEDLTHSQDEEVASFAICPTNDSTTESSEDNTSEDHTIEELSPLASQLLAEVQQEQEAESFESTETASEEPAEEPPASQGESLADVLSRMQADGEWSGLPGDDDDLPPVEPVQETPAPVSAPAMEMGVENEDVEDYMSQLLSRMRGDEPAPAVEAKPVEVKKQKPQTKKEDGEQSFVPPENPLKAEEFVPKQKAKRIESLGAMRELANSTSRRNIKVSETQSRKELGFIQLGITICGGVMAAYYFVFATVQFFDMPFMLGVTSLGAAGFCGFRFYKTIKHNEEVAELEMVKSQKMADKPTEPQQA